MGKAKPRPSYWKRLGEQFLHRTGLSPQSLSSVPLDYKEIRIKKRSGGIRILSIPNPDLKRMQQTLLRKLFRCLPVHPAAKGFVRRRSVADHAALHCGKPYVLAMDIRSFFESTTAERIRASLEGFGWEHSFVASVCRVVCHPTQGGLPQGAPTSPALSNIVNSFLDYRLSCLADRCGYDYSRYADDLAFSPQLSRSRYAGLGYLKQGVRLILEDCGYEVQSKKTRVLRQGRRQVITGLVVNDRCALPRTLRRRLRAAEHRQSLRLKLRCRQPLSAVTAAGEEEHMTAAQLHGWQSYLKMVSRVACQQSKNRASAELQGVWCVQDNQHRSRSYEYGGEDIPPQAFKADDIRQPRFIIEGDRITHVWPVWEWICKYRHKLYRRQIGRLSWRRRVGRLEISDAASHRIEIEWSNSKGERWSQDMIYALQKDRLEFRYVEQITYGDSKPQDLIKTITCIRLRTIPSSTPGRALLGPPFQSDPDF